MKMKFNYRGIELKENDLVIFKEKYFEVIGRIAFVDGCFCVFSGGSNHPLNTFSRELKIKKVETITPLNQTSLF